MLKNQPEIKEGDNDNKFTGYFVASDLKPEDLHNLFDNKNPFANNFTDNFETKALNTDKVIITPDRV